MCGIIGYIGPRETAKVLIEGLKRLEYRGYDSAGIAIFQKRKIEIRRKEGKLTKLEEQIGEEVFDGRVGIGHTRWATHGRPSDENAHPHKAGKVAVVHNGIIENYFPLKEHREDVILPFKVTETLGKFDVFANTRGGGISGQAEAIRLGVARALVEMNPDFRPTLKIDHLLRRDPRMVERKKYGQPKARKRFQFSKR